MTKPIAINRRDALNVLAITTAGGVLVTRSAESQRGRNLAHHRRRRLRDRA